MVFIPFPRSLFDKLIAGFTSANFIGAMYTSAVVGSVKQIEISKPPSKNEPGEGRFLFSDRYSVFDWGAMPDLLPGKGAALCLMSAYNFELLERAGIATHYRGLCSSDTVVSYRQLEQPSSQMAITVVNQ